MSKLNVITQAPYAVLLLIVGINAMAIAMNVAPVINLSQLLHQISGGLNSENAWFWLMIGSTLLPTLLHFLVAILALLVAFPDAWRAKAASDLRAARKEGNAVDHDGHLYAWLYLYVMPMLVLYGWVYLVYSGGRFLIGLWPAV